MPGDFGARTRPDAFHHLGHVRLDGLLGDAQLPPDLPVGAATGYEPGDLALTSGKGRVTGRRRLPVEDAARHRDDPFRGSDAVDDLYLDEPAELLRVLVESVSVRQTRHRLQA